MQAGYRVKVEILDAVTGTVRYHWPCGHVRRDVLLVGPKGPGSVRMRKPMSPEWLAKMVAYWNQAGGLGTGPCPTCGGLR